MFVIVVGNMGFGKTTYLKKRFILLKKNKVGYAPMPEDLGIPCIQSFHELVKKAGSLADTVFVIDEAATVLPREKPDPEKNKPFNKNLLDWWVNSRKLNNIIVFSFHSLNEVPTYLIQYTNYFTRFNTSEKIQKQINRFEFCPPLVASLKNRPILKRFEKDEIKIQ